MAGGIVKFTLRHESFGALIEKYAAVANKGIEGAFRDEAIYLADELTRRTPPFSGKAIRRMISGRENAKFNASEIENASALAVGKRRVEKDIRKVIYGLEGASLSARARAVSRGSNPNSTDWGTLQKCEGKRAVRVFATKSGEVYGADISHWLPGATTGQLSQHHQGNRTQRGRVTMAGQKTRNIGRWRWLDVMVVPEPILKKFITFKQKMVGQAKGGWAASYIALGGKLSQNGWIGKHAKGNGVPRAGYCKISTRNGNVLISMVNESAWASGGDPDRVIESSLEGRSIALSRKIRGILEGTWGSKARRSAEKTA